MVLVSHEVAPPLATELDPPLRAESDWCGLPLKRCVRARASLKRCGAGAGPEILPAQASGARGFIFNGRHETGHLRPASVFPFTLGRM